MLSGASGTPAESSPTEAGDKAEVKEEPKAETEDKPASNEAPAKWANPLTSCIVNVLWRTEKRSLEAWSIIVQGRKENGSICHKPLWIYAGVMNVL